MSPRLPLSYPQRIIWTTEERQPGTAISTLAGVLVRPPVEADLFERAAQIFASRTPWLGMRIGLDDEGNPVQKYVNETEPIVDTVTVASYREANERMEQLAAERIEMYGARLFQLTLFQYPSGAAFLVRGHHILFDGTTLLTVMNEIVAEYDSLRTGVPRTAPAALDYAAYLDEEAAYLESARCQRDEEFWDELFATVPEAVGLRHGAAGIGRTRRLVFGLPDRLAETLVSSHKTIGHSGLTAVLGLFAAYVGELTGVGEIALSTSVLGRSRRFEHSIGMFANVVPVRLRLDRDATVRAHLDSVRDALFGVLRHGRYPQERITERYRERTGSTGSLFDINVTYQDAALTVDGEEGDFHYRWFPYAARNSSLEINLTRRLVDEPLHLNVDYRLDVFEEHEVTTLMTRFLAYLERALGQLDGPLRGVQLATDDELATVTHWSQGPTYPQAHDNLVSAFREAVQRRPEALAISDETQSLTYREVDQRSDAVARLLRSHGVRDEAVVPLLARRSAELLVWILGIVKAGGAYLPLDVDSPADRIAYVLRDSQAYVVCRDPDVEVEHDGVVVNLCQEAYAQVEATPLEDAIGAGHLAYVIYTSGSTGRPKGAMVEHGSITNRLEWMCRHLELGARDVFMFKSPYVFDVSLVEVYGWFFAGARVVVLPSGAEREPARILELVDRDKPTYAHFVPSMLGAFLDYVEAAGVGNRLSSLRHVVASGEVLLPAQVRSFKANLPGARLHNFYGPTEAAVDVSAFDCSAVPCEDWPDIPIGTPIANTSLYVVTAGGALAPAGVPGELLIGGANVGRGYLNQCELTERSFSTDHFRGSGRLYRTGDTVIWRRDGILGYIGRRDGQVKVRGYRIELAEIERQIQALVSVEQAVVVAPSDGSGSRTLFAYVVLASDAVLDEVEEGARQVLPQYMVPNLLAVREIPLTANGKVDRRSLTEQAATAAAYPDEVEAGVDVTAGRAETLAAVWREVLNVAQVRGSDSFFALGGDSIKAIRVVTRLRAQGLHLEVRDFMEEPVLNRLAERSEAVQQDAGRRVRDGDIRPLPLQAQFLRDVSRVSDVYNQFVLLEFAEGLPSERLVGALDAVLAAHEVFALRFSAGAQPRAAVAGRARGSRLRVRTTSDQLTEETARGVYLDPLSGPLADVLHPNSALVDRALIQVHHLAIDVVSWHLVLSELSAQLRGEGALAADEGFAMWCDDFYADANLAEARLELPHWRRVVAEGPRPVRRGSANHSVHRPLGATLSSELHRLRDEQVFRPEEILTAAVAASVGRHYGVDFQGQIESHGRHALPASGRLAPTDTVGWFTARFPLPVLPGGHTSSDALWAARRALQETPGDGLGYGLLVEAGELLVGTEPTFVLNYVGEVGDAPGSEAPPQDGLAFKVLASGLFDGRRPDEPSVHVNAGTNQGILFVDVMAVGVADPADIDAFADQVVKALADCVRAAGSDRLASTMAGATVTASAEDLQAVLAQIRA